SVGWCLTLGASHAALIASHWPERAQAEIFGADGHFRAPHRAGANAGTCRRVDGGYVVDGVWGYASGVPGATHFIGNANVDGADGAPIVFVLPRERFTILDDWGG